MKHIPSIKTVMTAFPYWIDVNAPLEEALWFMQEHLIQHLPVKDDGRLVGVVTERDINRRVRNDGKLDGSIPVKDIYIHEAYVVDMNEPLDNVLNTMANEHIGSALVVKGERLAGLFTMNDACRVFASDLRDRFRPANGNDAA